MHIICTQENLKKAILCVERVTTKNSTLPILENMLVEIHENLLKFSATNLEIGVTTSIGAKIDGQGSVALPVKVFSDFVKNLPSGGQIELSMDNLTVTVESGVYSAVFKGCDAQEFPIIPQPKNEIVRIVFSAQEFKEAIRKVMMSVSVNAARIEFTGICFIFRENGVFAVSTDSFRLSEVFFFCTYTGLFSEVEPVIIPQHTIAELVKLMDFGSENVTMVVEENQVFFILENNIFMVSRLINGKFPDYKQIIPNDFSTKIVVSKTEIQRSVKMAEIFSPSKALEVFLDVLNEEGKIKFYSESSQSGINTSYVSGSIEGDKQNVVLNPKYILDFLSIINSENVYIGMNSSSSPVVFREIDASSKVDNGYQYILMPIKK